MATLYIATDDALAVLPANGDRGRCDLRLERKEPTCVAADPLRPELVYCGTFGNGIWRSDDAGRNWRFASEGVRHDKIYSLAVSRTDRVGNKGVIYAGTEPSAVFRSEDGGDSWRECSGLTDLPSSSEWSFPPRPETHHARWIHADPHQKGRIFVAIEAGALVRSADGGKSWIDRVPSGPVDTHELAMHLSVPNRLYSAAGDGYFESLDGGENWQQLEDGLAHSYVWSVAVDAGDPDIRIVASAASARQSHYKKSAESFIYRRVGDEPWQVIRGGLPDPSGRRTAVLAAHPTEPGEFFAVWESDIFRSTDGGASWDSLQVSWPEGFRVGEPGALAVAINE